MLQISSFLIAPPSLLLLCMYPLPLRSNDRASFPRFASETAIFRRPFVCSALCSAKSALPPPSIFGVHTVTQPVGQTFVPHNRTAQPLLKLCSALAEHCHAMPCDAFALLRLSLLCPCCVLPCHAMPLLCFAMPSLSLLCPRFATQIFALRCLALPLLSFAVLCLAVQCFPSQCLRHVFLGFAMPLHCASKPCLCCAPHCSSKPCHCHAYLSYAIAVLF